MDTSELGAGQNPCPNEQEKCFIFDFIATTRGYGYVYAKTREEALALIKNKEYDDITETYGLEIEEITDMKEE